MGFEEIPEAVLVLLGLMQLSFSALKVPFHDSQNAIAGSVFSDSWPLASNSYTLLLDLEFANFDLLVWQSFVSLVFLE